MSIKKEKDLFQYEGLGYIKRIVNETGFAMKGCAILLCCWREKKEKAGLSFEKFDAKKINEKRQSFASGLRGTIMIFKSLPDLHSFRLSIKQRKNCFRSSRGRLS